jgi:GH24 family phage-related lysozyme (muramidase)
VKRIVRKVGNNFAKDVLLKKRSKSNQFNALVSLAYNIELNGFAKATVLKRKC